VDAAVSLASALALVGVVLHFAEVAEWAHHAYSFLLYAPVLQALMTLDLGVLRMLCNYFDLWYLLGSDFIASLTAFSRGGEGVESVNVSVTSAVLVICCDALRLPVHAKLRNATVLAVVMVLHVIRSTTKASQPMELDHGLLDRLDMATLHAGRALTLALFFIKFVVHLARRPHVFVVIKTALRVDEGVQRFAGTLSKGALDLSEGGAGWKLEDVHVERSSTVAPAVP
jgi:hypothetical protein